MTLKTCCKLDFQPVENSKHPISLFSINKNNPSLKPPTPGWNTQRLHHLLVDGVSNFDWQGHTSKISAERCWYFSPTVMRCPYIYVYIIYRYTHRWFVDWKGLLRRGQDTRWSSERRKSSQWNSRNCGDAVIRFSWQATSQSTVVNRNSRWNKRMDNKVTWTRRLFEQTDKDTDLQIFQMTWQDSWQQWWQCTASDDEDDHEDEDDDDEDEDEEKEDHELCSSSRNKILATNRTLATIILWLHIMIQHSVICMYIFE